MKKIFSIIFSLLLVFSVCATAFAEDTSEFEEEPSTQDCQYLEVFSEEEISSDYECPSEEESLTSDDVEDSTKYFPELDEPTTKPLTGDMVSSWNDLQHISVTFFISVNSLATVSYHAVAQHNSSMEVTIYFEKLVLGSWKRVNIGTNGNKLTNRGSGYYISGTETVKISGEGTYRAVVSVKNSYGSGTSSASFTYNKSSSLADVNNDGKINAMDARLALRFAAGLQKYNSSQKARADINGDGTVTASDARIILRISAKLM